MKYDYSNMPDKEFDKITALVSRFATLSDKGRRSLCEYHQLVLGHKAMVGFFAVECDTCSSIPFGTAAILRLVT
jgi:hypothetical protein